ncbi:MAG: hypothetical protein GC200_11300 [Tepidisphaera sp.]|nr:hypothetical protein [Tepidisphaera sp.]
MRSTLVVHDRWAHFPRIAFRGTVHMVALPSSVSAFVGRVFGMPRPVALASLALCVLAGASGADVILSRPQSPTGGLIASSWLPPDGFDGDVYAWDNFTIPVAASITEIQWQGDGFGNGSGFTITIHTSPTLPDQPGVLAHYNVPGNAGQTPAGVVNGSQRYNYHYTLNTPLQLAAGTTYWINIEGIGGWSASWATGGNGSHINFFVGLAMFLTGPGDPAFTLIGTPACTQPSVNINPVPVQVCGGGTGSAMFSVGAAGSAPFTYHWRKGSVPIDAVANPSAATQNLVIANVTGADGASYDCVITNSCGNATSNPALLTVLSPTDPACGGPTCDPDVNQDGVADQGDVDYLVNAIAGGGNPTGIDPDFNHDGVADQGDIDALINVIAGGQCP